MLASWCSAQGFSRAQHTPVAPVLPDNASSDKGLTGSSDTTSPAAGLAVSRSLLLLLAGKGLVSRAANSILDLGSLAAACHHQLLRADAGVAC